MTDEERARQVVENWKANYCDGYDGEHEKLAMKIALALAAVREECAKVAEDYAEGCKNADERIAMDHCVAIAQAIRTGP